MKIINTVLKRPIGTSVAFIVVLVFGIISLFRLKVSLLPEITYPKLTIITLFQNVPPKEIENLITAPIEEAVMSVKGVKRVQSVSRQGISVVIPVFRWGTNIDVAGVNVREKLDMIKNILPDEVSKPIISRIDPSQTPTVSLGVFWDKQDPIFIKRLIDKEIKPEIERINGVAKVTVKGGVEEEIVVAVDLNRLNGYGLSLQQVLTFIKNANYNFPAGNIVEGKREYLIRVDGEYKSITDIAATIVGKSETGGLVKVSDIASVYSGTKERTSYFLLNGNEGIGLDIIKENNANDIEISKDITKLLKKINEKFGSLLKINVIYNSADFIESAINGLFVSGILAIIITFIGILIFMKNYKLPILVIITVPISFLITFLLMYLNHMTLNIMSLGGIDLGIGMVVDSSLVIIEEIEGKKKISDIYDGVSRVALSIIASVSTVIIVFLPLIFVGGIAGMMFGQLALTITFSMISSIIVALFLVPVLYILTARGEQTENPKWYKNYLNLFKIGLDKTFKNSRLIITASIILFIAALMIFMIIKKEFMPVVDKGEFNMKIFYKNGTPIDDTKAYSAEIAALIQKENDVKFTAASIGYDSNDPFSLLQDEIGVHIAEIKVILQKNKHESIFKFVDRLSQKLKIREDAAVLYEIPRNIIADVLELEKADFSYELYSENKEELDRYAEKYQNKLEKIDLILKCESSKKEGKPQVKVTYDNEALAGSGISSKAIYDVMATAIKGSKASSFRRDDDLIDIKVILDEKDRSELNDITRLNLSDETGLIPIFPFIKNEKVSSPSKILRKNQKEYIKFTGNFKKDKLKGVQLIEALNKQFMLENKEVSITGGETAKETKESFNQLESAFILSLFLVFALLAIQFESLLYPLLIMFSVPLSFFGSLFLLFIFNQSINLNSVIGIIMLSGIVVNNAILLFDRYRYNMNSLQWSLYDSIYNGTLNRFKPVNTTTLTTVVGLIPMAIGIGGGSSELQAPLALSVIGGLTVSTILTLYLMPVFYYKISNSHSKRI